MIRIKDAKGVRGVLINSLGSYFFRVYEKDGRFTDYDIKHFDLEIEIIDDNASLVKRDGINPTYTVDDTIELKYKAKN